MSRQSLLQKDRRPFFLYIDEFHNFTTPSMVWLFVRCEEIRPGFDTGASRASSVGTWRWELFSAVISNPYTRICFRVGDQDDRKLESGFSDFDCKELQSLSTGQAICRMERADFDFNLETLPLRESDDENGGVNTARITDISRAKYALPREEIEKILAASRPVVSPSAPELDQVVNAPAVSEEEPVPPPVAEKSPAVLQTRDAASCS